MSPLKGNVLSRSSASLQGRSSAIAPVASTFARVVSKCVLFGTTRPLPATAWKSRCSAARPWWTGITSSKPRIDRTVSRNRSKLLAPA
jgi:hypothetical protein